MCRAPIGTRKCASEELEGCACETTEDRRAEFHRNFRIEDIPILVDGEVEEDLIEVNDDSLFDIQSSTQTTALTSSALNVIFVCPRADITAQDIDKKRLSVKMKRFNSSSPASRKLPNIEYQTEEREKRIYCIAQVRETQRATLQSNHSKEEGISRRAYILRTRKNGIPKEH